MACGTSFIFLNLLYKHMYGNSICNSRKGRDFIEKLILDACCGSRMFWFNRKHPNAIYMDNRELEDTLCDGRKLVVKPDIIADFRCMPFQDNSFKLVVFDPPHLVKAGDSSWLAKKYGKLNESWPTDLKQGFDECMRVLELGGTLIFKWNEDQIKLKQVLDVIGQQPLFGDKRSKTHWLVFIKDKAVNKDE